MHFKVSTVVPMPAAEFFVERDSAAFRALVAKSANLGGLDIVEGWLDVDVEVYRFVTTPDLDKFVPKRLQKHFKGGKLQYTDIIKYDPAKIARSPYVLDVTSIPPILAERSRIECTLTIEDKEPGKTCRQTLEGEVAFSLMGLGPLAERIVVDSLQKVYLGIPAIVQRWVDFREEVLKLENGREVLFSGRVDNTGVPWITDSIKSLVEAPLTHLPAAPSKEESGLAAFLAAGQGSEAAKSLQSERGPSPKMMKVVPRERLQERGSAAAHQPQHPAASGGVEQTKPLTENEKTADGRPSTAEELHLAAHPQHIDGQTFFDAQEEWDWSEEAAAWEGSPGTETAVRADHAAAVEWYRQAKERGEVASGISLQESPSLSSNGKQHRTAIGQRFSEGYNKSHAAWDKFWDEHKVPKVAGMDSLKARMTHLFYLANKRGTIKFHRSRKPSEGASSSVSSDTSSPRQSSDDGLPPKRGAGMRPSQDSAPRSSHEEVVKETDSPTIDQRTGEQKHRTPIGKAISQLRLYHKRSTSSDKAV